MLKREEIEEKYKWDLKEYFISDEAWEKEFAKIKKLAPSLYVYEGKLSNDNLLLECLKKDTDFSIRMGKLYVYASLKLKEDATNSKYQHMCNKLEKLSVEISANTSYISSEIKEFSNEKLNTLAKNKVFKNYDLMFKAMIKNKKHMLSKAEEKLLSQVGEFAGSSSDIFDMFDSVDVKFEDVINSKGEKFPLNNSNYGKYIQSEDAKIRESAFKNLHQAYGNVNFTLGANYMANVKTDCFGAKVRGFKSSLDASIWAEDVPNKVYKMLIKQVNKNLPLFHKYFELKRRAMKLKVFNNYDVNAKYLSSDKKYSYEDSYDIVKNVTSVFGEEYVSTLQKAKDNRWIDVFPNLNKDTGAFSWGAYGANPVVLLNHEDTERCLFTLAHELGHMMHTYFSNKSQTYEKAGYEIFVAEVASNVNEMILAKKMLKNCTDKKQKMYYIDYVLNMFYGSVFRQTMFAEFEDWAHSSYEKGEDTSTNALNDYYYNLNKHYFGDKVNLADEVKYEWSRIPHFYTSFYVYKYATGLISALAIANLIDGGSPNAVENYIKFLSSGNTKPPVELLKIAGVNLQDETTFDNAFNFINDMLVEYEKLL